MPTPVQDLTIAHRELGDGPPVLMLHGWPTSSHLWTPVMPAVAAAGRRAIAVDLPGFGGSSKPLDRRYEYGLFAGAIESLLESLGVSSLGLVVHDIGGPIGLRWALDNRERVERLAILNTLVYPEFDEMTMNFVQALSTPGRREEITSRAGLEQALRLGLVDQSLVTVELLDAVDAPFATADDRRALAAAGIQLELDVFRTLADRLGELDGIPTTIIYGEQDRILTDIERTLARVREQLPSATVHRFPDAGHFLQYEKGEEVGALLADFFG